MKLKWQYNSQFPRACYYFVFQAKEFQAFWGEMSELRRFQDGSICEAVVWNGGTLSHKRGVTGRAIRYVLNR